MLLATMRKKKQRLMPPLENQIRGLAPAKPSPAASFDRRDRLDVILHSFRVEL